MNIIRRKKNPNYTTVSNVFLRDKELSLKSKGVMAIVMSLPNDWDFSISGLVGIVQEGESAIRSAIKELIDLGYCKKEIERDKGTFSKWVYTFSEEKEFSPFVENPQVENPQVENQGQLNKEVINSTLPKDSKSTKEKDKKRLSVDNQKKKFIKPTIEQIQAYIDEKKLHFDAERFFYHYESKGWMVGKNHMKDWKAACHTWENMHKSEVKEEEKEEELPEGLTVEKWLQAKNWMLTTVPRISGYITPAIHMRMVSMSGEKADVYAKILMEIEASGYVGSILQEFNRLSLTEPYREMIQS